MDDGATIYTRVDGNANGEPIVLVHGLALTHDVWKYQVPYLAWLGYKVVTFDLRGFGQSDKPAQPDLRAEYTYERWARDLGTIITEFNMHNIRLVGHSMGGAVAMQYASTNPGAPIKKLTLAAAAGPWMLWTPAHQAGWTQQDYDTTIDLVKKGQQSGKIQYYVDAFQALTKISPLHVNFPPSVKVPLLDWIFGMVESAAPQAFIGGIEQFRDRDLRNQLANIQIPTKIFHGNLDLFVQQAVRDEQLRCKAGAKRVDFPFSGHLLFVEEMLKFNMEITW